MKIKKIKPTHTDERGVISHIMTIDPSIETVLVITSKPGAIRANHYHKKDTHYTYLVKGKFEYYEKQIDKKDGQKMHTVLPGELVITKPNIIHAMKFLEESVIVVLTTESRDQKHYEADTVRVSLV